MAKHRCAIHDQVFETQGPAPGEDETHPSNEAGHRGHHDCPGCKVAANPEDEQRRVRKEARRADALKVAADEFDANDVDDDQDDNA